MADQGGIVRWTLDADDSQLLQALDRANRAVATFSQNLKQSETETNIGEKAAASAEKASRSFSQVASDVAGSWASSLNSMGAGLDRVLASASQVESAFGSLSAKMTVAATAAATLGTKSGLGLAQQMEDAATGLKFILGSEEEAAHAITRIRKEAERTPFDVGNLAQFTQQLATFTHSSDKAIDALMAMGGATVSSGYCIENLGNAVINLGQAFNNTWTYMDYRQMLNSVPMFKTIAYEAGLTW